MLFLYEIGVEESRRRLGVGSAMIEFLKDLCRSMDCYKMFVITSRGNVAAVQLYTSRLASEARKEDSLVFTLARAPK